MAEKERKEREKGVREGGEGRETEKGRRAEAKHPRDHQGEG